jgi:aralkylamine N-acetyltransferase
MQTVNINYSFDLNLVSTPELETLFNASGLGGRKGDKILRAFRNSQLICLAKDGSQLVGCSRAITDWEYHACIYDVAVIPEYQGRGIGRGMLEMLLEKLPVWRVMLVADGEVQGFYEKFGFHSYPDVMARLDWENLEDTQQPDT